MVIKLENGVPIGYPILESNFKQLFPNTVFPPVLLPKDVEPFGYGVYDFSQQPEVEKYQKLKEEQPIKNDFGVWKQVWSIVDMTDEEKQEVDKNKNLEIKGLRNSYLFSSDWTRLDDVQLSAEKKEEWANYRQLLRDITQQSGFPWDVNWPSKPE